MYLVPVAQIKDIIIITYILCIESKINDIGHMDTWCTGVGTTLQTAPHLMVNTVL